MGKELRDRRPLNEESSCTCTRLCYSLSAWACMFIRVSHEQRGVKSVSYKFIQQTDVYATNKVTFIP